MHSCYFFILVTFCYNDIKDDRFDTNVFDMEYQGDMVRSVISESWLDFHSNCYNDVSFMLTDETINSFLDVLGFGTKTMGAVVAIFDGREVARVESNIGERNLRKRHRVKTIGLFEENEVRQLEFYIERALFETPEDKLTLIQSIDQFCDM